MDFNEGTASAKIDGLWGYINKSGNFFIEPRFDYATDFREGLAYVSEGNHVLYVNLHGSIVWKGDDIDAGYAFR